jgi:hypothetical protein
MDAIENIALIVLLMLTGASVALAVIAGLIYFLEVQDD